MNVSTYPVARLPVWSGELFCDTVISVAVPVYCVPECRLATPKATNPASSVIAATRNRRLQIRARCARKLIGMFLPRCLSFRKRLVVARVRPRAVGPVPRSPGRHLVARPYVGQYCADHGDTHLSRPRSRELVHDPVGLATPGAATWLQPRSRRPWTARRRPTRRPGHWRSRGLPSRCRGGLGAHPNVHRVTSSGSLAQGPSAPCA